MVSSYFFEKYSLRLARYRGCKEIIEESLLHPPFHEWKVFAAGWGARCFIELWGRGLIEILEGSRDLGVMFGLLLRSTFLYGLRQLSHFVITH